MGNRGTRSSLSQYEDEAFRNGYPPCPTCQADTGEACRTPGQKRRAPHKPRQVLIEAPAAPRDPTPRELFYTYRRGWTDGAAVRAQDSKVVGHLKPAFREEYTCGYRDGRAALNAAMEAAAKSCGYEPSILRVQEGGEA